MNASRRAVASILRNEGRGRIYLYVRRLDADSAGRRYAIVATGGADAGQYRWRTRAEAIADIAHIWGGAAWDLQFS